MTRELEVAVAAAREAGEVIASIFGTDFDVEEKGDRASSPLTEADTRANAVIHRHVEGAFPEDGWLSEETRDTARRLDRGRCWIVDPLDGTREFVDGISELAVSIALVRDGEPVLGVVWNPMRDELWAADASGPHPDSLPVAVTNGDEVGRARVLASRSETKRGEWEAFRSAFDVVPMGSVAYKLGRVAGGFEDATFTLTPKHEWDIAAGVALVRLAGGRVTGTAGEDIVFNQPDVKLTGLVASNGALHEGLLEAIRRHREK